MAGTTFTWRHALQLHSTLSPFDSPIPATHSGYQDNVQPISWERRNVAGMLVTFYGLDELPAKVKRVTCLWVLHGRGDTQDSMSYVAASLLHAWNDRRQSLQREDPQKTFRPAIAVAIDQCNHGSRMIDDKASLSWRQGNTTHAQDMFNQYTRTAHDVSFLISCLPMYLPFNLAVHVGVGISLGAHVLWQLLVTEPRVTYGIVALGSPDFKRLLLHRAIRSKLPSTLSSDPPGKNFLGSKDFPQSLIDLVGECDPAGIFLDSTHAGGDGFDYTMRPSEEEIKRLRPMLRQRLGGKKIICLRGGKDGLVPDAHSKPFHTWLKAAIDKSAGWAGDMGVDMIDCVDLDARHEVTKKLRAEAERWLCEILERDDVSHSVRNSML